MLDNIPEDIKNIKIGNTPLITVLWYLAIGFVIGGIVTKQIDSNEKIDSNYNRLKEYIEQEVGGLRSDWERELEETHRRLNILESKHTK